MLNNKYHSNFKINYNNHKINNNFRIQQQLLKIIILVFNIHSYKKLQIQVIQNNKLINNNSSNNKISIHHF